MNNKKKMMLKGGIILLSMGLFVGCGMKPIPEKVYNEKMSNTNLYVSNFESITNRPNSKGFKLNDYSPFGFDTDVIKGKMDGILWPKKYKSDPKNYRVSECEDSPATVLTMNIIVTPFLLGTNLIFGGGRCTKRIIFEHERFDKDVKLWVETNKIDRNLILTQYESLVTSERKAASKIHALLENYKENYLAQNPKISRKYNDKTGFYKDEHLALGIKLRHNVLHTPKDFIADIVDAAFPCKSTMQCVNNIKDAKNIIEKNQEPLSQMIASYENRLKEESANLHLTIPQGMQKENFGKKTLYYTIGELSSEVPVTQKHIEALYTITTADFSEIYPSYANENRDLKIAFNPRTLELQLQNNTKQFIQLNSISMYYGDNIYQLLDNQSANFARELSPESTNTNKIPNVASESSYTDMTKEKALTQNIHFGFAVKYTIGDSTKNNTLYELKKYSAYDLLKNY